MKTWNKERKRTRDLLLEYDYTIMPPHPRPGGLIVLYPWSTSSYDSGTRSIMFTTYDTFPEQGITNKLYFDLDEKILYYWDNEYIPVNAMLIANTTIDGGEA